MSESDARTAGSEAVLAGHPSGVLLPLVRERDDRVALLDETSRPQRGDVVEFAVDTGSRNEALRWLRDSGWRIIA